MCKNYARNTYLIQKHPECKKGAAKNLKKGRDEKKTEIEMGGQGWCSVSADENKILIITIQAAKY